MFKTFNISDVVLHAYNTDPFQILKKLKCHAYVINLLKDFYISSIFNIEDIVDYKCLDFNPSNFFIDEPSHGLIFEKLFIPSIQNILSNTVNQIDEILDDEVIMTSKYLVR